LILHSEEPSSLSKLAKTAVMPVLSDMRLMAGTKARMSGSTNRARMCGACSSRKRRRKAGEERTARRKARQVKAAQVRLGRSGRRKKISRRRSSVRALMVVGAGGGGEGGSGEAMAVKARTAAVRCGLRRCSSNTTRNVKGRPISIVCCGLPGALWASHPRYCRPTSVYCG
jgi:hypothetical protein